VTNCSKYISTKYLRVRLFCLGLSPPKRRVLRWQNIARTRADHVQDLCWVLYL